MVGPVTFSLIYMFFFLARDEGDKTEYGSEVRQSKYSTSLETVSGEARWPHR